MNEKILNLRAAIARAATAFGSGDPAEVASVTEELRAAYLALPYRREGLTPDENFIRDEEERTASTLLSVMDAAYRVACSRYAVAHRAESRALAVALARSASPELRAEWAEEGIRFGWTAEEMKTVLREEGISLNLTVPEVLDEVRAVYCEIVAKRLAA